MTSSTVAPSPTTHVRAPRVPPTTPRPVVETSIEERYDGLTWTARPGYAGLLAAIPAEVWSHPERNGWQRVKKNARREVWRAEIRGGRFYVKYYSSPAWRSALGELFRAPSCQLEYEAGMYALQAGIHAVRPAAYTLGARRAGRRWDILITEAIAPVVPLDEFWSQLCDDDDAARRRADTATVIDLLAEMIARAHQAGFEHRDMHAANILVQPVAPRQYHTLFVDLQTTRTGIAVADHVVVSNLAQLNQWFRRNSTIGDRLRFLRSYLRWRDEYEHVFPHSRPLGLRFEQLVQALAHRAGTHAERLGTRRDHRVMRDGRYFGRVRLPGGWRANVVLCCKHASDASRASQLAFERDWWQTQLRDPLHWFAQQDANQVCKDSHSAMVCRALLTHADGNVPVIFKRPRARNWQRALTQMLPISRSLRGWRMGHALLHRDVPAARPLAVLERRLGPLVLDSLLLTEAIPGSRDLESFLRQAHADRSPAEFLALKRRLVPELGRLLRRLHERGFDHRDCKASNILVTEHPELQLTWIDMDGLRHVRRVSPRRRLRPLVRLHVSLLDVPGLTRTDRVRFLKAYFTRFGAAPDEWRTVWPDLVAGADAKTRQRARRKAWKLRRYGRE